MNKVKTSLLALSIMLSISLSAQLENKPKTAKQHEIGLASNIANLSHISFIYRMGKPNAMWRLGLIDIVNSSQKVTDENILSNNNNTIIGIGIGKEFRKLAGDKLEFRFGGDLIFHYSSYQSLRENTKSYSKKFNSGISAVLGFNYLLNKHLILGVEVLPQMMYEIAKSTIQDDSYRNRIVARKGFTTRLSNQSVLLSLAYRL